MVERNQFVFVIEGRAVQDLRRDDLFPDEVGALRSARRSLARLGTGGGAGNIGRLAARDPGVVSGGQF